MAKATVMAVVNQKGGTGKTTTCENLGVGLAMEGKKVLLVDTDPQASLTICLGHPVPDQLSPTLSDMMGKILSEQPIAPGEGILHHPEGVDLMPANIELSGLEVSLVMVELNDKAKERVSGMVELRRIVNELIEYQLEDYPDDMIQAKQAELNAAYDAFTAKNGLINNRANSQAFADDSS